MKDGKDACQERLNTVVNKVWTWSRFISKCINKSVKILFKSALLCQQVQSKLPIKWWTSSQALQFLKVLTSTEAWRKKGTSKPPDTSHVVRLFIVLYRPPCSGCIVAEVIVTCQVMYKCKKIRIGSWSWSVLICILLKTVVRACHELAWIKEVWIRRLPGASIPHTNPMRQPLRVSFYF